MSDVVFAVPFALETTMRFVRAAASLDGVRLALITQEAPERFPAELKSRVRTIHKVSDALDPDELTDAVRKVAREGLDGNVDRLVGVLEQLQVPLAQVRERLRIPGMDVETARNFREKGRMKDVLRAADLPCARHHVAHDAEDALRFADECGYPLVVKPPDGAGAKNTARVERRAELESYLRSLPPSPDAPLLLEEFIQGEEHSFDTISLGGRHVFHSISDYYPSPLEVMENRWIQWCVLLPRDIDVPEYADIKRAGVRALDALGMVTGLTHMEWFRRPDGSIAISEVAARPPGAQFTTLISHAHELDFYEAWARLVTLDRFDLPERRYACGAAFLRGQGDGRVRAVHGLEEAQRELGDLVVEAKLPRQGQPQASSYEGEGFVILRHPETEVVREALRRCVELVHVELG